VRKFLKFLFLLDHFNLYERRKKKKKCGQTFAEMWGYKRIVPNILKEKDEKKGAPSYLF